MELEETGLRFQFGPPITSGFSSTLLTPSRLSREERLEAQVAELTTLVKALVASSQERGATASVLADQTEPGLNGAGNNGAGEQSAAAVTRNVSHNNSAGLNRSQAAILASIRVEPVTKLEMEYRRNCPQLPSFNGDPTTWFRFYTTYQESTAQGGYSATMNMERLRVALIDPARRLVQHFFEMPHRLEDLMQVLYENFGRPEVLVNYVTDRARRLNGLDDDLSNISDFYA